MDGIGTVYNNFDIKLIPKVKLETKLIPKVKLVTKKISNSEKESNLCF